jgi:hypothetical protein
VSRAALEKFAGQSADKLGSGWIIDVDPETDGSFISPVRTDEVIGDRQYDIKSLFYDGCVLAATDDPCHEYVTGLPGCTNIVFRAGGEKPLVARAECDREELDWIDWSMPCPDKPPKVVNLSSVDQEEGAAEYTNIVYTYVNRLGWESGPSLPSQTIQVSHGNLINVTDIVPAPASAGIVAIRVYAFAAGLKSASATQKEVLGAYRLATSIKPDMTTAVVRFPPAGEALTTTGYESTPIDVRWLAKAPHGLFGGIVGNTVAFSTPNVPWSWPMSQRMVFYGKPRGFAMGETYAYVLTDAKPFVIDIGTKECKDVTCRRAQHTADAYPCISGHSVAIRGDACIYATHDGLIELTGLKARYLIKPAAWQWLSMYPHEMIGCVGGRTYYGFTPEVSFALNLDTGFVTELSVRNVSAACALPDGRIAIASRRNALLLHRGLEFKTMRYEREIAEFAKPMIMSAWKINARIEPAEVVHVADGVEIDRTTVFSETMQRLPRTRARNWRVSIRSKGRVDGYAIAHGAAEL